MSPSCFHDVVSLTFWNAEIPASRGTQCPFAQVFLTVPVSETAAKVEHFRQTAKLLGDKSKPLPRF